jgi:hypothetical protein
MKRGDAGLCLRIIGGPGEEYADPAHPLRLPGARRERPRNG